MKERENLITVVTNTFDENGVSDFIQCLGVTNSYEIAYGIALMHLSMLKEDDPKLQMTSIYRLEGDTGYGISLKDKDGKIRFGVFVLNDGEWRGVDGNGDA